MLEQADHKVLVTIKYFMAASKKSQLKLLLIMLPFCHLLLLYILYLACKLFGPGISIFFSVYQVQSVLFAGAFRCCDNTNMSINYNS